MNALVEVNAASSIPQVETVEVIVHAMMAIPAVAVDLVSQVSNRSLTEL